MIKKFTVIIPLYNREDLILRALDSIPKRKDLEIIVVDDCSTDMSLAKVENWKAQWDSSFAEIKILKNEQNFGVGYTKGRAYESAEGQWLVTLDSDDYFLTEEFERLLEDIESYKSFDIIRFDNELNNGQVEHCTHTAGWSYLLRNRFNIKYPTVRKAEDWLYWLELQKARASVVSTTRLCYHYNYPHRGSLVWQQEQGQIDWRGNKIDKSNHNGAQLQSSFFN